MGSRSYIGRLRADNVVEFVYCHLGAQMENNGKTLLAQYTDDEAVAGLIAGGGLSSINVDGTPSYYDTEGNPPEFAQMPFSEFHGLMFEPGFMRVESLFLWRGYWTVKSDWHIEGCDGSKWHRLEDVIPPHKTFLLQVTVPGGADADDILGNICEHVEQENKFWQTEGMIREEEEVTAICYAKLES